MQTPPTRRHALGTLAAASTAMSLGLWPGFAGAQSGVVKFILPNATGSGVDAITRAAQAALGKALGANVVVENQPGAGGVVGLQALAKAAPDGNTWLLAQGAVATVYPHLYDKLAYDPVADLRPVSMAAEALLGLAVGPPGAGQLRLTRCWHAAAPDGGTAGE